MAIDRKARGRTLLAIAALFSSGPALSAAPPLVAPEVEREIVAPEGVAFAPSPTDEVRGALAPLARPDNLVVVSSFPPRLPWSVGNAMARNHLICGLSGALIVIEAGDTGGTLAAGRAALAHGVPLFVVDFAPPAAPGNALLLAAGGVPLRRRPSGEPNLDAVLAAARALSPRDGAQIR